MWLSVLVVAFLCPTIHSFRCDYYWRDYFGMVPSDAFLAARDVNGGNLYIGQSYIRSGGLAIGQIFSGVKEMSVSFGGIIRIGKYSKILCSPRNNFFWLKANATDLHLLVKEQHAVIGGHDDILGFLNIGRATVDSDIKIGKIAPFSIEHAKLFYSDGTMEKYVETYDILMCKKA